MLAYDQITKTLWIKEISHIISGEYTGSSRCTISAANDLPCRMASATEVIISGYGMTCSASINIWSNSLQRNTIFSGALLILVQFRIHRGWQEIKEESNSDVVSEICLERD